MSKLTREQNREMLQKAIASYKAGEIETFLADPYSYELPTDYERYEPQAIARAVLRATKAGKLDLDAIMRLYGDEA